MLKLSQIELRVRRDGDKTQLLSPEVGLFTECLPSGSLIGSGQLAGTLIAQGRPITLVVPSGVAGRVTSEQPKRMQEPVGYGTLLYELIAIAGGEFEEAQEAAHDASDGLVMRASQSGRFYHRPSPDEAPYVELGAELKDGQVIGLMEIMKTFSQVSFRAGGNLPARAKLLRWLVGDGAEVREGEALLEVESASKG